MSDFAPSDGTVRRSRWLRNALIALGAIAVGVALFASLQTEADSASLQAQAERSVPLEVATQNQKPTLVEFYANWCTSCQAMAGELDALRQTYGSRVDFVMLNVDSDKWLPEMLRYRVDGIPHFVFLDAAGEPQAQAVGEQPRPVLEANLQALAVGEPLPHRQASGSVSALQGPTESQQATPRSHGSRAQ